MIELEVRQLAGSEVLHACPQGQGGQPLPCIVFYHGFTSSKIVYSYFAVALAQAGFRVLMPDAWDHGSRYRGDEQQRLGQFWPILLRNFADFPALRDAIVAEGWLAEGRLAVGGASMGGMTALGLMTRHPELRCVASLMGSGFFSGLSHRLFPSQDDVSGALADWDVGQHLAALGSKPLLLWHGEEDDVVPADESIRLQQALIHAGHDSRLTCRWQAGVRHRITPEAVDAAVAFFGQQL